MCGPAKKKKWAQDGTREKMQIIEIFVKKNRWVEFEIIEAKENIKIDMFGLRKRKRKKKIIKIN
jgi:hypothetical protein